MSICEFVTFFLKLKLNWDSDILLLLGINSVDIDIIKSMFEIIC